MNSIVLTTGGMSPNPDIITPWIIEVHLVGKDGELAGFVGKILAMNQFLTMVPS